MDTKDCPTCGCLMIKYQTQQWEVGFPPLQEQIWWCVCGHTEKAPARVGVLIAYREFVWNWVNRINGKDPHSAYRLRGLAHNSGRPPHGNRVVDDAEPEDSGQEDQ